MTQLPHLKFSSSRLFTTEIILITLSITASAISLASRQTLVAATSVPLTVAVGLSSWNRKKIEQIIQQNQNYLDKTLFDLSSQAKEIEAKFTQTQQDVQFLSKVKHQINDLYEKIQLMEELLLAKTDLSEKTIKLDQNLEHLTGTVNSNLSNIALNTAKLDRIETFLQDKSDCLSNLAEIQNDLEILKLKLNPTIPEDILLKINSWEIYDNNFSSLEQKLKSINQSLEFVENQYLEIEEKLSLTQGIDQLKADYEKHKQITDNKLKSLDFRYTQLLQQEYHNNLTCEHCHKEIPSNHKVKGGEFGNHHFCSDNCKIHYEKSRL